MTSTPALLLAAAGVGFGHAILPDHWVPLAVIARTQRHPLKRVARLSILAGAAHVALSIALGAVLIGVGLQFRSSVQRREDLVVGGILLATGALFLVLELLGLGHRHSHDHPHETGRGHGHGHGGVATLVRQTTAQSRTKRLAAFAVPFGAAASPDLTILPVFLAAATVSAAASFATLIIFSAVTVATIVGLTLAAAVGGYRLRGAWLDKGANVITAGMLLVIGGLVATGSI